MCSRCKVLSFIACGAIYFNLSSYLLTCNPDSYLQAAFYTIKTKQAIGLRAHCDARETGKAEAFVWSPLVRCRSCPRAVLSHRGIYFFSKSVNLFQSIISNLNHVGTDRHSQIGAHHGVSHKQLRTDTNNSF